MAVKLKGNVRECWNARASSKIVVGIEGVTHPILSIRISIRIRKADLLLTRLMTACWLVPSQPLSEPRVATRAFADRLLTPLLTFC